MKTKVYIGLHGVGKYLSCWTAVKKKLEGRLIRCLNVEVFYIFICFAKSPSNAQIWRLGISKENKVFWFVYHQSSIIPLLPTSNCKKHQITWYDNMLGILNITLTFFSTAANEETHLLKSQNTTVKC